MADSLEHAREGLEHAHHAAEGHAPRDRFVIRVAILISALAAALALAEMREKSSQNEYLTHHVALSDDWAFYQAKTIRWDMKQSMAQVLESLPMAKDPPVAQEIAKLHADEARLNDDEKTLGRKQLQARAVTQTAERDEAFHRYHAFEYSVGALQIAIVLASVSVVTRQRLMAYAAGAIGGLAALFALLVETTGIAL